MTCHSTMVSIKLLELRKSNILLAEELKLAEMSEENYNYCKEKCEGKQDLIRKLNNEKSLQEYL